ncbi:MAG: YmdB family metallophosphoesterase, partial [Alphaproteobacteria bacterium]
MRILFLGDIVGRAGRDAVVSAAADLRRTLDLDLLVVNAENAAHGFGLTPKICKDLY